MCGGMVCVMSCVCDVSVVCVCLHVWYVWPVVCEGGQWCVLCVCTEHVVFGV